MMTAQQLKNSILQRAIEGKLVEQRAEEGTAKELLKEIKLEKEKLVKEGKIKKSKALPPITEDERPFDIPDSWEWVRLGELLDVIGGTSYKKSQVSSEGLRVLRGGNIDNLKIDFYDNDVFLPLELAEPEKLVKQYDIIVVASTGSKKVIGKPGFIYTAHNNVTIGAFLRICRLFNKEFFPYISLIFSGMYYRMHIRDVVQGTNINNMKKEHITEFLVPLPPLSEQHRIVAKIEELMPLVDQYDKTYSQLTVLNEKFPQDMKKSILQYAIEGKLVEQRPEEGTAKELLKEIKLEKEKLVKEGKIKKSKPLPPITEDEIPFDIPDSWEWVRLIDVTTVIGDGIHGTPSYDNNGTVYFVNGNNLCDGKIVIKPDTKRVLKSEAEKHFVTLDETSFLVSINGTIGNTAFYNNEPIILGKSACYFNLLGKIDKKYIKLIVGSDYYLKYALSEATGTTIKNVSLKSMRKFPIPLPSLSEQHRIVAKIEELMPLCDKLVKTK